MPRKSKKSKELPDEKESVIKSLESEAADVKVKIATPQSKCFEKTSTSTNPFEDRRKEMQRKLQKMVMELRAEGRSEADIKYGITREKRKEERRLIAEEEKRANEQKACTHDVIIVPVAWKRNHHEKVSVDVTCDNVRRALFSTGLNPWLDCRREYSPGQKFAYWEHMGVKHRIEIGPEDISQGVCRVVRADTPGAYLEHKRERPELNLQSIVRTLASLGLGKCQEMNTDLMSSESLIESPSFEQFNDSAYGEEDEVGGNAIVSEKPQHMKKFRRF
jgi:hypothetical protein